MLPTIPTLVSKILDKRPSLALLLNRRGQNALMAVCELFYVNLVNGHLVSQILKHCVSALDVQETETKQTALHYLAYHFMYHNVTDEQLFKNHPLFTLLQNNANPYIPDVNGVRVADIVPHLPSLAALFNSNPLGQKPIIRPEWNDADTVPNASFPQYGALTQASTLESDMLALSRSQRRY